MNSLPESCLQLFEAAGWFPGRSVDVHFDRLESLRSYDLAEPLLREFGGLHVGKCGPGRDCATSDIEFSRHLSVADRYAVSALESPGSDLFPMGQAHLGHLELFLDERGRLFAYGVPDGSLQVVGESFFEGVERLLIGL
jgi:SUKH-3 immunity protein